MEVSSSMRAWLNFSSGASAKEKPLGHDGHTVLNALPGPEGGVATRCMVRRRCTATESYGKVRDGMGW